MLDRMHKELTQMKLDAIMRKVALQRKKTNALKNPAYKYIVEYRERLQDAIYYIDNSKSCTSDKIDSFLETMSGNVTAHSRLFASDIIGLLDDEHFLFSMSEHEMLSDSLVSDFLFIISFGVGKNELLNYVIDSTASEAELLLRLVVVEVKKGRNENAILLSGMAFKLMYSVFMDRMKLLREGKLAVNDHLRGLGGKPKKKFKHEVISIISATASKYPNITKSSLIIKVNDYLKLKYNDTVTDRTLREWISSTGFKSDRSATGGKYELVIPGAEHDGQ